VSKKRITVEQWISDALTDADKGKPCSALALVLAKGTGHEEIHTKEIQGPQDAKRLADFFISKATGYSQDLPGIQTFKILAFYGQSEPQATFPFTVAEGALTGGEQVPFSRHEASPNGLFAQLMKHNEAVMSMNMQIVQTLAVGAVTRDQEIQRERNEMNMIMRDMLLTMRKEGHEMQLAQLRYQRETEERRVMAKAIPSIANYLTGREVIPENFADSELIDAIAQDFSPEDIQMLVSMGKLKAEKAAILVARISKAKEDQKKRLEAFRTLPDEDSALAQLANGKDTKAIQ